MTTTDQGPEIPRAEVDNLSNSQARAGAPESEAVGAAQPAAGPDPDTGARILIADDDASNQKVILHLLRRMGHSADTVTSGNEALTAVMRQPYALVLMDIYMPQMDGREATRQMRALPLARQPHVYALTAAISDAERQSCLVAGMEGFISKPVAPDQLRAVLQACGIS